MAHQTGPLLLKGRLGTLSFYFNRQYGYLVRQSGGPSKGQVATSSKFERTRENASEFGLASVAGKLIRRAVKSSVGLTGDSKVAQRLTGLLVKIGKTDFSAVRGNRNPALVFDEPASRTLLRSFAFYDDIPLSKVYTGRIDCDTIAGSIVFVHGTSGMPAQAKEFFRAPKAASHIRIKTAIIVLDFEGDSYVLVQTPACFIR